MPMSLHQGSVVFGRVSAGPLGSLEEVGASGRREESLDVRRNLVIAPQRPGAFRVVLAHCAHEIVDKRAQDHLTRLGRRLELDAEARLLTTAFQQIH